MSDKETSAAPVAAQEEKAASPVPVVEEEEKKEANPAPAPAAEAETETATESAPVPAEEEKPKSDSAPKTNGNGNGESANGNGNGNGDAPVPAPSAPSSDKQTRTSSRTKQESSSKPAPAPKAPKAPKQARSSSAAAGASKKVSGGDKNFSIGDIVLARLKGFPAWPARIADPDTLAQKVLAARPGKSSNTFCVQYFPVGDYSWLNAKDLDPLSASDISAYLAAGHRSKTGGLKEAYQTAQDPTEWDEAQMEAAQKAQSGEGEAEIDELDEEEGDDVDEPSAGGKRKKANGGKEGAKKKVKTEKKKDDSAKPKKVAAKPKAGKKATESKPVVENQASGDDAPNPECAKVKDWRHKLQRAFLSKSVPEAEEMQAYDDLFKSIERYDGMTLEALQYSKIGKVMKKIAVMENIPRDAEYKITDRASKLMVEWQDHVDKAGEGKKETNGGMEVDA